MRHARCTVLVVLLAPLLSAGDEHKPAPGTWLDNAAMSETRLPAVGDVPSVLEEFEYREGERPKAYVMDLDGDGAPDVFVKSSNSLCGTGGCLYALIEGRTRKRIGSFFGAPLLVLDRKVNGYPVIQSYAHLSADSGNFVTYVFDGEKYQAVTSTFVEGKSLDALFKQLSTFRKLTAPTHKSGS